MNNKNFQKNFILLSSFIEFFENFHFVKNKCMKNTNICQINATFWFIVSEAELKLG
jgi:hypothetical protein